jgi:Arc/MetJ family transcription regulator
MAGRSNTVKKTYNLPPELVHKARRALGVRTETEAVILALKRVSDDEVIARAVKRVTGRLPDYQPLR